MYVLSHVFYELTHSERWTVAGPLLLLYAGLALYAAAILPALASDTLAVVFFSALTFFNPQLLMWGISLRWYSYWTALALVALALHVPKPLPAANHATKSNEARPWAYLLSGIILGVMYYLNYLSIFFGAALAAAALIASRDRRRVAIGFTAMAITAGLMALPQVGTMLHVHLPGSGSSQQSSAIVAAARMFHGVFISEAILPWRPIAMVFAMVVAVPLFVRELRFATRLCIGRARSESGALPVFVLAFFVVLGLAGCVTGLGVKPRSFIVLSPVLGTVLAFGFLRLSRKAARYLLLAVTCVWAAWGANDLLRREGTAKGGMNDHPEEVSEFVRAEAGPGCGAVFTHDPGLAYVLTRDLAPLRRFAVISTYPDWVHGLPEGNWQPTCQPDKVFVVTSTVGSLNLNKVLEPALTHAVRLIDHPAVRQFGPDPDVRYKRLMAGPGVSLPSFRFTVQYGPVIRGAGIASAAADFREVWRAQDAINRARGGIPGAAGSPVGPR